MKFDLMLKRSSLLKNSLRQVYLNKPSLITTIGIDNIHIQFILALVSQFDQTKSSGSINRKNLSTLEEGIFTSDSLRQKL